MFQQALGGCGVENGLEREEEAEAWEPGEKSAGIQMGGGGTETRGSWQWDSGNISETFSPGRDNRLGTEAWQKALALRGA